MGSSYLIDSNGIIDLLAEKLALPGLELVVSAIDEGFQISLVNQIEALAYSTPVVSGLHSPDCT